jgi:hypothetical protein
VSLRPHHKSQADDYWRWVFDQNLRRKFEAWLWQILSGTILPGGGLAPGALPPHEHPPTGAQGTFLVSGGQVTWVSGYTYRVSAGTGVINGTLVSWAEQIVELDPAHATLDRIDVIGVDSGGLAFNETGQAASDPSEPVIDPSTQLKLALVTVGAGTTEPSVSSVTLYAENDGNPAEWDWTTSGSGWNLAATDDFFAGSVAIKGTDVASGAYAEGQSAAGTLDPSDYAHLVFYLKFGAAWAAGAELQVTLRRAGVQQGSAVRVAGGFFGLDGDNTGSWQSVVIPLTTFAVPGGEAVNQVRLTVVGGSLSFWLDAMSLTTSGVTVPGDGGLTQEQADARYLQRSNNLSDLASATTARTSLGLNQLTVREVDGSPTETEPIALEFPNGTLTEPSAGVVRYTPGTVATDELAKVSANDSTAGYLNGKLVAGTGILLTEQNDGLNETLQITASGSAGGQYRQYLITDDGAGGWAFVDLPTGPVTALFDLEA